jgi:Skp family chaperone for outer membrane proteins
VRFTRDVLADPDRAEEIADESLEDYAERRKIKLINPQRRRVIMSKPRTKAELEAEVSDLQNENQELQDQLDAIADIVRPDDASGEEEADEDGDQEDEEEDEDDDQD